MASVGVWDLQYENTLASAVHRATNRVRRGLGMQPTPSYYHSSNSRSGFVADEDGRSSMGDLGAGAPDGSGGEARLRGRDSSLTASIDGNASPLFAPENMAEVSSFVCYLN
jgi:hypothetical protein